MYLLKKCAELEDLLKTRQGLEAEGSKGAGAELALLAEVRLEVERVFASPISTHNIARDDPMRDRLLSSEVARSSMELGIIESIINDPDYAYDSGIDADFTTKLTDKVHRYVAASRKTPMPNAHYGPFAMLQSSVAKALCEIKNGKPQEATELLETALKVSSLPPGRANATGSE